MIGLGIHSNAKNSHASHSGLHHRHPRIFCEVLGVEHVHIRWRPVGHEQDRASIVPLILQQSAGMAKCRSNPG